MACNCGHVALGSQYEVVGWLAVPCQPTLCVLNARQASAWLGIALLAPSVGLHAKGRTAYHRTTALAAGLDGIPWAYHSTQPRHFPSRQSDGLGSHTPRRTLGKPRVKRKKPRVLRAERTRGNAEAAFKVRGRVRRQRLWLAHAHAQCAPGPGILQDRRRTFWAPEEGQPFGTAPDWLVILSIRGLAQLCVGRRTLLRSGVAAGS